MSHHAALKLNWILLLLMLLVLHATTAIALNSDREQPLRISAGSADINQQTHHGVYLNQVTLDQGSTHIRAAMATTTTNEQHKLVVAVIQGEGSTQAHYWMLTAEDKPPLHAYADTIRYYPERHLIELIGHARVEQGNNSFSAHTIRYDTAAEHVVSESDGHTRTTIIVHPENRT